MKRATESAFDDLLGIPWVARGESIDGADCLGITNLCLVRRGVPRLDIWSAWHGRYDAGWRGFDEAVPVGWHRVVGAVQQDDVLIARDASGRPSGVAYVDDTGNAVTSIPGAGAVRRSLKALAVESAWRHECRSA